MDGGTGGQWFDPSVQTSTALTHFTAGKQDWFQDTQLGQQDRSVFSETNMMINDSHHAHVRDSKCVMWSPAQVLLETLWRLLLVISVSHTCVRAHTHAYTF